MSNLDRLARKFLDINPNELKKFLGLDANSNPFQANWVRDRPDIRLEPLTFDVMPGNFPASFLKRTYALPPDYLTNPNDELLTKVKTKIEASIPQLPEGFTSEMEIPTFLLCDILSVFELKSHTKEYLGSLECYERAFAYYPSSNFSNTAKYNMALSYMRLSSLSKAVETLSDLRKAVRSRSFLHAIDLAMAECMYQMRAFNKAKPMLKDLYNNTSNEIMKLTILVRLADIAFSQDLLKDCYDMLSALLEQYPKFLLGRPASYFYLAEAAFKLKRYEEALGHFTEVEKVWKQKDTLSFITMRRADVLFRLHRNRDANSLYLWIHRQYPATFGGLVSGIKYVDGQLSDTTDKKRGDFMALLKIINTVASNELYTYLRHEVFYRQGLLRIYLGEDEDGISLLKIFCKRYPRSYRYAPARFMIEKGLKRRMQALFEARRYDLLLTTFAEFQDMLPLRSFNEDFLIYICKAFDYFSLYRQIAGLYEQIPPAIKRKESGNGVFHLWVAKAYNILERNEDAVSVLENIPYKTKNPAILRQVYLYQVEVYRRMGRYADALESMTRLVGYTDAEYPASRLAFMRGELHFLLNQAPRAEEALRQSVSLYAAEKGNLAKGPRYVRDAHYIIADMAYDQASWETAAEAYERFIDLYPDDYRVPIAQYRLHLNHIRAGRLGESARMLGLLRKRKTDAAIMTLLTEEQNHAAWKDDQKRPLLDIAYSD